jgi:hypothetical protein
MTSLTVEKLNKTDSQFMPHLRMDKMVSKL